MTTVMSRATPEVSFINWADQVLGERESSPPSELLDQARYYYDNGVYIDRVSNPSAAMAFERASALLQRYGSAALAPMGDGRYIFNATPYAAASSSSSSSSFVPREHKERKTRQHVEGDDGKWTFRDSAGDGSGAVFHMGQVLPPPPQASYQDYQDDAGLAEAIADSERMAAASSSISRRSPQPISSSSSSSSSLQLPPPPPLPASIASSVSGTGTSLPRFSEDEDEPSALLSCMRRTYQVTKPVLTHIGNFAKARPAVAVIVGGVSLWMFGVTGGLIAAGAFAAFDKFEQAYERRAANEAVTKQM